MAGRRPSAPSFDTGNDGSIQVPKLNADITWSLRPWPVVLSYAGRDWEIPALPAADWIAGLLAGDVLDLMEALLSPEDSAAFMACLRSGDADLGQLQELMLDMVRVVGSRPWWVTLRLLGLAEASWDSLGAEMLLKGVDAQVLSFSAWLDVLMLTALRNMDRRHVTMFTMKLEAPPAEEVAEVAESIEMSRDAFLALSG